MSQALPVTANLPPIQTIPLQIVSPSTIPGGGGNTSNTVAVVSGNSTLNSTPNNATTSGSAQLSAVNPGCTVSSSQNQNTRLKSTWRFCSSEKIAASAALAALAIGVYYFYDQHYFSARTWNLGVWKDCHDTDLQEISTSAACQRYKNSTYDDLVGRSMDVLPQESLLTISDVKISLGKASRVIGPALWFSAVAAVVSRFLAYARDMTSGHYFLRAAFFVGSLWITSISLATQLSHPIASGTSLCLAGLFTFIYRSLIPSAINFNDTMANIGILAKRRRRCGITNLVCSPFGNVLILVGQFCALADTLSPEFSGDFGKTTDFVCKITLIWLIGLLALIWFSEIIRDFSRDPKSLMLRLEGVSHKVVFLKSITSALGKISYYFKYLIAKNSKRE